MSPSMVMMSEESSRVTSSSISNGDPHDQEAGVYQKGVKHMYDNGVEHVPDKYIWPVEERPNVINHGETITKLDNDHDQINDFTPPIIDLAELKGPNRSQVLHSLAHACEEYGIFQIVNHGISKDVTSNTVNASKLFFEQPVTEREKYMSADLNSIVRYGTSFNQTNDVVFSWRDFLKLVCAPMPDVLSHWPSSPQHFREIAAAYAQETKQLFITLAEAIVESLMLRSNKRRETLQDHDDGDENEIKRILKELESGNQLMIMNCFPPCPEPDLTLGMPPHSDYGFLTLLLQDEVKGLQIQHRQRWLTVEPIPGSFVVNVGDHLEIFSNGRYKSVLHRVLVNATRHRLSVATLHCIPFTSTVRPWPMLIDEMNLRRFKDTNFGHFIDYIKSCDSKKKNFLESRKIFNSISR